MRNNAAEIYLQAEISNLGVIPIAKIIISRVPALLEKSGAVIDQFVITTAV